jgi:hypothetical protein
MNKEFALKILTNVELHMLESQCSLAKETYRYLENLERRKRIDRMDKDLLDRIYDCRHKKQW